MIRRQKNLSSYPDLGLIYLSNARAVFIMIGGWGMIVHPGFLLI